MKKSLLLILVFICVVLSIHAQILDEKDKRITELENQVKALNKDIDYYKETLNLMQSTTKDEDKGVIFTINSVVGDSKTGNVLVSGILVNKGKIRYIGYEQVLCFDPQGNEFKSSKKMLGADGSINELELDIPVKFSVEFSDIPIDTPLFTMLKFKFFSSFGIGPDNISITYRNTPIVWR